VITMGLLEVIFGKRKELEEKKFPKDGDFVKVNITSQYVQDAHGVGEVVETKRHPGWTCVRFEDSHVAYFPTADLIITEKEEIADEAKDVERTYISADKPVEELKQETPKKLTVEMLEKLNKKTTQKEPEPNLEELVTSPFRIPIRRKALEKAYAYIELIPKVLGRHEECYGHLLALENDKTGAIVEDVTLSPKQSVNSVRCEIGFDAVAEAGAEIKDTEYRVVGWWHSHHTMGEFFSGTDDDNIDNVRDSIIAYKSIGVEKKVKFAYGLTLTARKDYYAEISFQKVHACGRTKDAEILILEGGNDFDVLKLEEEIAERINTGFFGERAKKEYKRRKAEERKSYAIVKYEEKPLLKIEQEV